MFLIAKYKAIKIFEYQGAQIALGQELILEDAAGKVLVKDGLVTFSRYLLPENNEDKILIDAYLASPKVTTPAALQEQQVADASTGAANVVSSKTKKAGKSKK